MQDAFPILDDPRWQAVLARDATADGGFVFAVRSTGIYCRPSCPARRPKPENVAFFDTAAAAEAAGFRPCLRCYPAGQSPAEANAALISAACRLIEQAEDMPRLTELAARIGMSPWHFHRQFKRATGLTPQAWAKARRAGRLRAALAAPGGSVTDAIYAAGFEASSRAYAQADDMLGMTPSAYRGGGAGEVILYAIAESALGQVLVAQSTRGICAITLGDQPAALVADLAARFPKAGIQPAEAALAQRIAAVVALVEQPGAGHDLPLDLRGTAFQRRVWLALQQIPPGQTASYAEIAAQIGAPTASRAVAGACAANALAVAVPCHRVLRVDGALSGYRWGTARKAALLEREAARSGD